MGKKLAIVSCFLVLAAISFAGGILVAEKKVGGVSKKSIENPNQNTEPELVENVLEKRVVAEETKDETAKDNLNTENNAVPENAPPTELKDVKFSFAILGDTQYFKPGTNGGFQRAAKNIKKLNPELIFAVGDLISSCDGKSECDGKLDEWKKILGDFVPRTYVMMGNHDRVGEEKADEAYRRHFNLPTNGPSGFSELTYSFDHENSHFVVLSSDKPEENLINEEQRNWLEQDLSRNKLENIFVFFHEPAYPTNSKIGESLDANPKDRDALWEILTRHKVKAVFSGHEQIQSRRSINGVYQFVFGNTDSSNHEAPKPGTTEYYYIGQAFGLVEINGDSITVKTYSVDGKLLNSFNLKK